MEELNYAELIPEYVLGRLDPSKREALEKAIAQSDTLRAQLEEEKTLFKVIRDRELEDLRRTVAGYEKQAKGWQRQRWLAAASIAGLILVSALFWILSPSEQSQPSYFAYYESYPNTVMPFVRSQDAVSSNPSIEAYFAYESGNYEKAVYLFSQLNESDPSDETIFYQAISEMELGRWQHATEVLSRHTWNSAEKGSFADVKDWYLALGLLFSEREAEAISLLEEIFDRQGYEFINAGKLLEQIQKQ